MEVREDQGSLSLPKASASAVPGVPGSPGSKYV
jgi:hypothetical protein